MAQFKVVFQNQNNIHEERIVEANYQDKSGKLTRLIGDDGRPIFTVHEDKLHMIEELTPLVVFRVVMSKDELEDFVKKGTKKKP